jgi:hypothetical protein
MERTTAMIRNQAMVRWMLAGLLATGTAGAALGADLPPCVRHCAPAPQVHVADPVPVYDEPLISPPTTPLLPGSSTLPGYYGRPFDYYYQGAYYGGPYVGYYWRLPYACGVYGYC